MGRAERQNKILELIKEQEIETQEELAAALAVAGFDVTQATVSRDIKELSLIKSMGHDKKYKYIYRGDEMPVSIHMGLFRKLIVSIQSANNLIVIKTLSGSANVLASYIDKLKEPEILGTVAGDDTILMVIDCNENALIWIQKLKEMFL